MSYDSGIGGYSSTSHIATQLEGRESQGVGGGLHGALHSLRQSLIGFGLDLDFLIQDLFTYLRGK